MTLIVTSTEKDLINELNNKECSFITKPLDIGDVHICHNDKIVYIIERKAKGDLLASIKDQRYKEQKTRMLQSGIISKNIIYIIENLTKPKDSVAHKQIWSSICNTQYRDNCSVFQTKNITETADYLISLCNSINKFIKENIKNETNPVNVSIKKSQVSIDDWFMYSLSLIPKCSVSIAKVIVKEYPTISSLIDRINSEGNDCLKDLRVGTSQRKLGKKLSNDICEYISNNF